jgi:hypothetical protein
MDQGRVDLYKSSPRYFFLIGAQPVQQANGGCLHSNALPQKYGGCVKNLMSPTVGRMREPRAVFAVIKKLPAGHSSG